MSRLIVTPSGRTILVEDDNMSDADALTSVGEPPVYERGPGPEGEGYTGGLVDYFQSGVGGLLASRGSLLPGDLGMAVEDIGYGFQERNPYAGQARSWGEAYDKGELGQYLGYQFASNVAPNVLGTIASGMAGGLPGALAFGVSGGVGDVLQRQAQLHQDRNWGTALAAGIPLGLMETGVGVGGVARRIGLGQLGEGAASTLKRSVGKGTVVEAGQEMVTEAGQRLATGEELWSPEAQAAYKEAGISGAIFGGPFGAVEHMGSGRRASQPDVNNQPGQPTDLLNPLPAQLELPLEGGVTRTGPTVPPLPPLQPPTVQPTPPTQLELPLGQPAHQPNLPMDLPIQQAPGTQLGLPMNLPEATRPPPPSTQLELPLRQPTPPVEPSQLPLPLVGGAGAQQGRLPIDIPKRPGFAETMPRLPMEMPEAAPPVDLQRQQLEQPELPLGRGYPPPPAGPLFGEARQPAPPAPEMQMEIPGVPLASMMNPDVVRGMIGGRGATPQSIKWVDRLTDRLVEYAQQRGMRAVRDAIAIARNENEQARGRKKNPISEATYDWRVGALTKAEQWADELENRGPEQAASEPTMTLPPEQLPLPLGRPPQPETQLGLPVGLPRPGFAQTAPFLPGVGEQAAGPRERLPEIEAWRQPQLPFERGVPPKGEAGPLFEGPPPPKPGPAPKETKQLSLPFRPRRPIGKKAKAQAKEAEAKQKAAEAPPKEVPEETAAAAQEAAFQTEKKRVDAIVDGVEDQLDILEKGTSKEAVRNFAKTLVGLGRLPKTALQEIISLVPKVKTTVTQVTDIIRNGIREWGGTTLNQWRKDNNLPPSEAIIQPKAEAKPKAEPKPEPKPEPEVAEEGVATDDQVAAINKAFDAAAKDGSAAALTSFMRDARKQGVWDAKQHAAFMEVSKDRERLVFSIGTYLDEWEQAGATLTPPPPRARKPKAEAKAAPKEEAPATPEPAPEVIPPETIIMEAGEEALNKGATFLRDRGAYKTAAQRRKGDERVRRLRLDRDHFGNILKLGEAGKQRLKDGVEAYLSGASIPNTDIMAMHGWNLAHLYQYGYTLPRRSPDEKLVQQPINDATKQAYLRQFLDPTERAYVEIGMRAAEAGLISPTNPSSRAGAQWVYGRVAKNHYFAEAAEWQGRKAKRGRPPRGVTPFGFKLREELFSKQGMDFTRRGFLRGISAAAVASLAKPVWAGPRIATSTNSHPDLQGLLRAGRPVDAMRWVAANSSSPQYRKLAKALLKTPGGFDSVTATTSPYLTETEGARGTTEFVAGRIEIVLDEKTGMTERTLLHEMLHAYVIERWGGLNTYMAGNKEILGDLTDRSDAIVKEFQDLWMPLAKAMREKFNEASDVYVGIDQFANSIDEALAWVMTDAKLQAYLRTVDINGKELSPGSTGSALYDFINWFLKAIGVEPIPAAVNAFDSVMSVSERLLEGGARVAPDLKFMTALSEGVQKQNAQPDLFERAGVGVLHAGVDRSTFGGFNMMIGPAADDIDFDRMAKAEEMERRGFEPHFGGNIHQATGWYKSHELGHWLMEITDHDMVVKQPELMKTGAEGKVLLEDLIDHPRFFKAYPQLRGLPVHFEQVPPKPGNKASYRPIMEDVDGYPTMPFITIYTNKSHSPAVMPSALLHEMQHAVQDQEGSLTLPRDFNFYKSMTENPEMMRQLYDMADLMMEGKQSKAIGQALKERLDEAETDRAAIASIPDPYLQDILTQVFNKEARLDGMLAPALYELTWVEMQARQTQARMSMTPEERLLANPNLMPIPSASKLELGHSIGAAFHERGPQGRAMYLRGKPGEASPAGTTPIRGALGKLWKKGLTPEQRELAAKLAPLVEGMQLKVGEEGMEGERGKTTIHPSGRVETQVASAKDAEAVLHETFHTATASRWGELKAKMKTGDKVADAIINRVEKLRAAAEKLVDANTPEEVRNAVGNIDEFLAYGRTSKITQDWMRDKKQGGLWGRFVDVVRQILGLPPKYGPLLNSMMRESEALLGRAALTAPRAANVLADKLDLSDPVTLYLKGARTKMASDPIHTLNERTKIVAQGVVNVGKTKAASYFAIRGDLAAMLARRMEAAKISSDPVKKLLRLIQTRDAVRLQGEQEVAHLNRAFLRLPQNERRHGDSKGAVNNLAEKMTRTGEWAFQPDWLEAADASRVIVNPDLAAQFNALSTEGQKHIKDLFRSTYMKDMQLRDTAKSVVDAAYADDLKAAKDDVERAKVQREIDAELKTVLDPASWDRSLPYAPLRRNGEWAVVGMSKEYKAAKAAGDHKTMNALKGDENHYFVDFARTEWEANHMRAQIQQGNPAFNPDNGGAALHKEADGLREHFWGGGDMPQAFAKVLAKVSGSDELKTAVRDQLRTVARQLYLRSLSDQNARKGALRRFNVASMPIDIQLNVEQHLKSQSYNLAAILHNSDILDSFTKVESSLEGMAKDPQAYADTHTMFNELVKRYTASMQPPPEGLVNTVLERARNVTSFWQLAMSPAFALQQFLQPIIMTGPMLEGRYGLARGVSALNAAYGAVDKTALGKAWANDEVLGNKFVDAKYRALLDYVADLGLLDVGISQETGQIPSAVGDMRFVRSAREWPRYMEFMNRATSAIAAYELELQTPTGGAKPDAEAYTDYVKAAGGKPAMSERQFNAAYAAAKLVHDTQGDYSTASASRLFRNPLLATMAQYRKIGLIVVTNYTRMISRALDSNLPAEERRIAMRSLAYSLGHVWAFAGVLGLPLVPQLFNLADLVRDAFSDDDEPPADTVQDIREAVGDPMLANLILGGVPTLFGLSMSHSLGQGQILSLQPYQDLSLTRDDLMQYMGAVSLGPTGGLAVNMLSGVGSMIGGDFYKGMTQFLPRGMAQGVAAFAEAQNGITSKHGVQLQTPEDISAWDTTARALSLMTEKRAGGYERGEREYTMRDFYRNRQSDLISEYIEALKTGDARTMDDVRKRWLKLQDAKAQQGFKRSPITSLTLSPKRRREQEEDVVGGVQYLPGEESFALQQARLYGVPQ